MKTRREFIRCSAAGVGASMFPGALISTAAQAETVGNMNAASWAGATDTVLLNKVWAIRFSNTLPWALDPTNAVLAKALNVDAAGNVPVLGVTLKPGLPQLGFILKPDAGKTNLFSVKAGQTPWPMLGPLGGKFVDGSPVPVTTLWGYGNHDLESIFTNGGGLGVTFPARSFVVQRGSPVTVNWYNNLVDASATPATPLRTWSAWTRRYRCRAMQVILRSTAFPSPFTITAATARWSSTAARTNGSRHSADRSALASPAPTRRRVRTT